MKHFTIENETSDIMIHGSAKEADALPNTQRFSNEAGLPQLAANWPAARLVEIWNSLPGETQVKKFKDCATAASRIWKAIQNLGETVPVAEEPFAAPFQQITLTQCRFKPANVQSAGLAAHNAKRYSFFVRN